MPNIVRDNLMDFTVLLRNNLTDPAGRSSNYTDIFNLTNEGTATLTQTKVKNVKYVLLDGVAVSYRTGYTVDYINRQVIFASATTGSVDVNYDYSSTWIYPEFPRLEDVTLPRISITQIGPSQDDLSVGNERIGYDFIEQVDIWTDRDTSYTYHDEPCSGPKLRDFIADDIVNVIRDERFWIPNTLRMKINTMVPTIEEVTRKGRPVRVIFRGRFDIMRTYFYSSGG